MQKQALKFVVNGWSNEAIQRQTDETVRALTRETVLLLTDNQQRAYLDHHRDVLFGDDPMNLFDLGFNLSALRKNEGLSVQEAAGAGAWAQACAHALFIDDERSIRFQREALQESGLRYRRSAHGLLTRGCGGGRLRYQLQARHTHRMARGGDAAKRARNDDRGVQGIRCGKRAIFSNEYSTRAFQATPLETRVPLALRCARASPPASSRPRVSLSTRGLKTPSCSRTRGSAPVRFSSLCVASLITALLSHSARSTGISGHDTGRCWL